MDGRWVTVLACFVAPAVLIGVTVVWFAANPLAIFVLLALMVAGGFYLVSYTSTFAGPDGST
jgi:hypothetical protein